MSRWNWKPIKIMAMALLALLALLLGSCTFSASAEDLYALPELPAEYEALSAQLSAIQDSGAEYAPPQSGGNLPPVQMVDLDGDGQDEVLAFFRVSSEERPLRIYIFRAVGDDYEQASIIDGSGTSIQSITYEDMDGDGSQEIIVSWSVSAELQTLSVYALERLVPVRLMSAPYARYEVTDLDSDGDEEMVVIRSDEGESAAALADFYDWDAGNSSLGLRSTARLSVSVAVLQWTQTGALQGGEPAVFVTGRDTGPDETSRAVTDILVYRRPDLVNIALSSDTGVSTQIFPFLNLQPADVNGDGVTDVPGPVPLPPDGNELYWKIHWRSYDLEGQEEPQAITYHNLTDRWYLLIPEEWDEHFAVRQVNTSSSIHATTFYSCAGGVVGDELMTIYTLAGTNREALAAAAGRVVLRRRADTIYAVSFAPAYEDWQYAVDQGSIMERFVAIGTQWSMK